MQVIAFECRGADDSPATYAALVCTSEAGPVPVVHMRLQLDHCTGHRVNRHCSKITDR